MPNRPQKSRAMVLTIVLMVMVLMVVMGMAMASVGTANLTLASTQVNGERAYQVAEAGLNLAFLDISDGTQAPQRDYPLLESPTRDFARVRVFDNVDGTHRQQDGCPVEIPPGTFYVYSTGKAQGSGRVLAERSVGALVVKNGNHGSYGVMARYVSLIGTGSVSTEGVTGAQGAAVPVIATNSTTLVGTTAAVVLGQATVEGTVVIPAGAPSSVVDDPTIPTGGVSPMAGQLNFPKVVVPSVGPSHGNENVRFRKDLPAGRYRNLTVEANGTAILQGTYVVNNLTVEAGGTVRRVPPSFGVDRPAVNLYVLGQMSLDGGTPIQNLGSTSNKMRIFYMGTAAATVPMNADSHFLVTAPKARLHVVANGDAVGALAANDIQLDLTNGNFLYDQQAAQSPTPLPEEMLEAGAPVLPPPPGDPTQTVGGRTYKPVVILGHQRF